MMNLFNKTDYGFHLKTEKFEILFGNRNSSDVEVLKKKFSKFELYKLKQTHSDIFLKANSDLQIGDAHWTTEKQKALVISTADCLPIMIYCERTHRAAAVHAGWRGVENQITSKLVHSFLKTGSSGSSLTFFVGPHIQQNSFEVDEDVFLKLKNSSLDLAEESISVRKNDKYLINLNLILKQQLTQALNEEPEIYFLDSNTMTDNSFISFRRDKESLKRNLSFISLL